MSSKAKNQSRLQGIMNINNRNIYQWLLRDYDYVDNPVDRVCSIVYFLIHRDYRRRGIAKQILSRIIEDNANKDIYFIKAYPRKEASSFEWNFKVPYSQGGRLRQN